jgi:hypothetical protein
MGSMINNNKINKEGRVWQVKASPSLFSAVVSALRHHCAVFLK